MTPWLVAVAPSSDFVCRSPDFCIKQLVSANVRIILEPYCLLGRINREKLILKTVLGKSVAANVSKTRPF